MKKRVLAVLLTVVMAAGLASCGGNKEKAAGTGDKITVTMWSSVSNDSTDNEKESEALTQKLVAEKFPNYDVQFIKQPSGTDYRQEYDKALMANKAPDVFLGFSYTDIPSRIQNGTIADITELVKDWDLKKQDLVIENFDKAISKDDKWYAIPRDAYVQAMLINKKAVQEGGGDINNLPKTWDEFAKLGQKITDRSKPRFGYELLGMDWCAWPYTAWVWAAGGEMVTDNGDGTFKISFNEAPGVDAAMYLHDMIWKYNMTQKNVLASIDDVTTDITTGVACYSWGAYGSLSKEKLDMHDLTFEDFAMAPMPVKDESIAMPSLAGGEVITFNPKADKETLKAAFEVAQYMYYDEEYLTKMWDFAKERGMFDIHIPARKDLLDKKLASLEGLTQESKESFIEMTKNAYVEPYCQHWTDLKSQLVKPLQTIFTTENITRDQIKAMLDDTAKTLYELYPEAFKE